MVVSLRLLQPMAIMVVWLKFPFITDVTKAAGMPKYIGASSSIATLAIWSASCSATYLVVL